MTVASDNPLLGFKCRRAEVYLSPGVLCCCGTAPGLGTAAAASPQRELPGFTALRSIHHY